MKPIASVLAVLALVVGLLATPTAHAGYADGLNQYAAYHVMHGGVDPSGMVEFYPTVALSDAGDNDRLEWRLDWYTVHASEDDSKNLDFNGRKLGILNYRSKCDGKLYSFVIHGYDFYDYTTGSELRLQSIEYSWNEHGHGRAQQKGIYLDELFKQSGMTAVRYGKKAWSRVPFDVKLAVYRQGKNYDSPNARPSTYEQSIARHGEGRRSLDSFMSGLDARRDHYAPLLEGTARQGAADGMADLLIAAGSPAAAACRTSGSGFHSFSAFKREMGPAGSGQAWHHLVEQTPGNIKRFGAQAIHNTDNVVRIPHGKGTVHAKISGYYSSKQPFTDGKTVREWLSTQSFEEQMKFGKRILQRFNR